MPPASQTAPELERRERERRNFRYRMVGAVLALMIVIFAVGMALINGHLRPDSALLWMALLCFAPAAYYGYGFLTVPDREADWGLILSALAWALSAIALCMQGAALRNAINGAAPGTSFAQIWTQTATPWLARLAALCALLCLAAGFAFSYRAWSRTRP